MKYSDISSLKQLANYLRCEEEYLTTLFNGYISVYDNNKNSYKNIYNSITAGLKKPALLLHKIYIPKKIINHEYRIVYKIQTDRFKNILKILNTELNQLYVPNEAAHGYIIGRSIQTNASKHLSKLYLLALDIKDYFETITSDMIVSALTELGYKPKIAEYLTVLLTLEGHLCLGYNTSPIIANIVSNKLDKELLVYSGESVSYTRYADDLYFSSNIIIPDISVIESIINKNGFKINTKKTKLMKRGRKQYVTGLTVFDNKYPRITKKIKRLLRLKLFYISKYGSVSHTCKELNYTKEEYKLIASVKNHVDYTIERLHDRIIGWLSFINSIEPKAAEKLYRMYNLAKNMDNNINDSESQKTCHKVIDLKKTHKT